MNPRETYAHTLAGRSIADWEPLEHHLKEVADLASLNAGSFNAAAWAEILGRCHDLGKGSRAFQEYLRNCNPEESEQASVEDSRVVRKVNHSSFGGRYVAGQVPGPYGQMLACCILGHHAGLPDAVATEDGGQLSTMQYRLGPEAAVEPVEFPLPAVAEPVWPLGRPTARDLPFAAAFFTRMLFSCLIDADRTCTEAFCDPGQAQQRQVRRPSLEELSSALQEHMDQLAATVRATPVNLQRATVLRQCQAAAALAPGFFSLQVPTGGGKTLSSLAFALAHAKHHGQQRVIVAIPYTSIIEQTAKVYRTALGALGEHGLIEHHTSLKPEHDSRENQFATENWDAPLIVTTNVQLFESMFAAKTTPCRKLHRLAHSVIVLDEAQTLPVDLLAPSLRALRELVLRYGCTVVLCTATQPALERSTDFPDGLEGVRPIIADPLPLFEALRRVEVVRLPEKQTAKSLADRMAAEPRALTIVNTRAAAAELFAAVALRSGPADCFHLSTLMCGAHRSEVLRSIREQVKTGDCRVISTQLVEAGVDLDFPVVFRAEAGFDSIAQAAGRCNREGRLSGLGTTYVYEAEQPPPAGPLRDAAQSARELWRKHPDPLAPTAIDAYFRHHYWRSADQLDKHNVLACVDIDTVRGKTRFQFRQMADRYRIIRTAEVPILIPYDGTAKKLLAQLENPHVPFVSQRALQPYLVSVPDRIFQRLVNEAIVVMHPSGVGLLQREDAYDPKRGLRLEAPELKTLIA